MFFIVILSVTACQETAFCGPWQTWQVKVKRFQMLSILRFKVKSCLTLCRPFIGNELGAEITQQNEMLSFRIKLMSKQFNDTIENKVIDMTTNNKINAAISIFIRIQF